MRPFAFLLLCSAAVGQTSSGPVVSAGVNAVETGRERFNIRCAGCHGQNGLGGERAPAFGHGWHSRTDTDESIRTVIRQGIPESGMPAFDLPDHEIAQLTAFVQSRVLPLAPNRAPQATRKLANNFISEKRDAPNAIWYGVGERSAGRISPNPPVASLWPKWKTALAHPEKMRQAGYQAATVVLTDGARLRGFIRNESGSDLQLQGFDNRLHLLSRDRIAQVERDAAPYMPPYQGSAEETRDLIAFLGHAPSWTPPGSLPSPEPLPGGVAWNDLVHPKPGDWPTYHGALNGNRYSALTQITPANVKNLAPKWVYSPGGGHSLETTPVVVDGVMYVTRVNSVSALDARTGREIWVFSRAASKGLVGGRRRRDQPRRGRARRSRLHRYRQRSPPRAAPHYGRPLVGRRNGGLHQALRLHVRTARGRRSGDLRRLRRR